MGTPFAKGAASPFGKVRNRNLSVLEQSGGDPFGGYYTPKLKLDMMSPKVKSKYGANPTSDYNININITTSTNKTLETKAELVSVNLQHKFNSY